MLQLLVNVIRLYPQATTLVIFLVRQIPIHYVLKGILQDLRNQATYGLGHVSDCMEEAMRMLVLLLLCIVGMEPYKD